MRFNNPVLRGFNPDPCLCRKADTFYLATSTFEYFPGVQLFSSKDAIKWDKLPSPLDSQRLFNLTNVPSSGGIWAPDLSYKESEDMFYLTFTVVTNFEKSPSPNQGFKDTHNYICRSREITGPWSDPVYVGAYGFDPSLFHDPDGKSYLMSMKWNPRAGHNNFDGIVMQEFDTSGLRPVGEPVVISKGTWVKTTEGPHIYKRNGYYYLFLAEGGTLYTHSVSVLRSRSVFGPYEQHSVTPLLSQAINREKIKNKEGNPLLFCGPGLQKTGHASICSLSGDQYLMAFLCARPDKETACCPLGRETALTTITFKDDNWPYLDEDTSLNLKVTDPVKTELFDDFDGPSLDPGFSFLRDDFLSKKKAALLDGQLVIEGGESPASIYQRFVGARITEFKWEAHTELLLEGRDYQQMAGLAVRYNEGNQYYFAVGRNEEGKPVVSVHSFIGRAYYILDENVVNEGKVKLKAQCDGRMISFSWSQDGKDWKRMNCSCDFTALSDDAVKPIGFTGSFCGLMANDMSGMGSKAYFDYFRLVTR